MSIGLNSEGPLMISIIGLNLYALWMDVVLFLMVCIFSN